jgi:hypothetical protein
MPRACRTFVHSGAPIMRKLLVSALLPLAALPAQATAQSSLRIGPDPRTELLSIVQTLGTATGRLGLLNRSETPYRAAVLAHFEPFRGHPAVECMDSVAAGGFSFDAPHHLMVHLTPPPELRPMAELPPALVQRAKGGRPQLDACLAHLRDFASESGFSEFYDAQAEAYEAMAAPVRALAAASDYVGQIESYFGESQAAYSMVLAPLLAGNFGPRIRLDEGLHIYGIISPFGVRDGVPVFATEDQLRYLVWHEFGHSFVNPLAEANAARLDSAASLLEPIRARMQRLGYRDWRTVVNEHVIRAVTSRLAALHLGEEPGKMAVLRERAEGFAYVDPLATALVAYEAQRDRYRTFREYYPQLLRVVADLSVRDLGPDFFRHPFVGPLSAVGNDSSLLIVLPTAEPDTAAQRELHDYVREMAARFFEQAAIVDDTAALRMDRGRREVILYGTPSGNALLASIMNRLPIRIGPAGVQAREAHEGSGYRVFTVWPSPWDGDFGLLIYTAQRTADVVGVHGVPHGGTDYVVARESNVLESGNYTGKVTGVWRLDRAR